MKQLWFFVLFMAFTGQSFASPESKKLEQIDKMFKMDPKTPGLSFILKKNIFSLKSKVVPTLVKVMKSADYPDQNRWQATMLLAQVMGKKSAPFIAKFSEHPNWMMRLASLKALLGLGQRDYINLHKAALKDSSLIVRIQALDNISQLKIDHLGQDVWNMFYDHSNYAGEMGQRKRTAIFKFIIKTLGDIKYKPALKPLVKLIQNTKYHDVSSELDYSLKKLTGKQSPDKFEEKRKFWSKLI